MNLLDLVELLEYDNLDTVSYCSPLKIVATGKVLGFNTETRVIDFGCGRGEALALWGKYFGVSGLGIDRDGTFCDRARQRLADNGLSERMQIVCGDASEYQSPDRYDAACCLNASDIWGGFQPTLRRLKLFIKPGGAIVIAEPYFASTHVPEELRRWEGNRHTERQLLDIVHEEGFELLFIKRASQDDADNYRAHFRGELQLVAATYMGAQFYGSAIFAMRSRQ